MKGLIVVLFISLASLSFAVENIQYCEDHISPADKNVCHNSTKKETTHRCCYEYYKVSGMSYSNCLALTKADFDDFKNYMKNKESGIANVKEYSLDCSSEYITISILSLILLLL